MVDDSNDKIGAKVRTAAVTKYPYRAVVGDKEVAERALALTTYGSKDSTTISVPDALAKLLAEGRAPVIPLRERPKAAPVAQADAAPPAGDAPPSADAG